MSLAQGRISVRDAIARSITPELERLLEEQRQSVPDQPIISTETFFMHARMTSDPLLPRPSQNIPYEGSSIEDRIVELRGMIEDDPEEPHLSEESESCLRWFLFHNSYLIAQCGIVAGSGIFSASWGDRQGRFVYGVFTRRED